MRENGGNKLEEKKRYTKPSELTAVGKTNAKDGGSAKKLYTKHTFTIYGTIRDLTKSVGQNGPADGGVITAMTQSHL